MSCNTAGRSPGRPLDPALEESILVATLAELAESGYEGLGIERVAQRAGSAKTSIYRRWPDRETLVLAAVRHFLVHIPPARAHHGKTLREDLLAHARYLASVLSRERVSVFAGLLLAMRTRRELAELVQEEFVGRQLAVMDALCRQAAARGEIAASSLTPALQHVLPGVLFTRLFVLDRPLDDEFLRRLVDEVLLPALARKTPRNFPHTRQRRTGS